MGSALSHKLLVHDFMPVYGTTEKVGGQQKLVMMGTPFTWATNNGILVVCDERGRPWIKRSGDISDFAKFFDGQPNSRGAYVPHSNDGGEFVSAMLRSPEGAFLIADKRARGLLRVLEKIMPITQRISVPLGSESHQRLKEIDLWLERGRNIQCAQDEAKLDRLLRDL